MFALVFTAAAAELRASVCLAEQEGVQLLMTVHVSEDLAVSN